MLKKEQNMKTYNELTRDEKDKLGYPNDEELNIIQSFINWTNENVDKFLWSELHCYSLEMWCGGITDCGVLLKNGQVGILDFKSAKESYDSHFIQCAGYDLLISENGGFTSEGKKIFQLDKPIEFYGVVPFGAKEFTVDFKYDTVGLREGFKSASCLYKLTNY